MFLSLCLRLKDKRREESAGQAVFPCIIEIIPDKVCTRTIKHECSNPCFLLLQVFRARDPIVLGVKCKEGVVKIGTPLCVIRGEKKEVYSYKPFQASIVSIY